MIRTPSGVMDHEEAIKQYVGGSSAWIFSLKGMSMGYVMAKASLFPLDYI